MPSGLFFLLNIALTFQDLCSSIGILGFFFSISVKNAIGILKGNACLESLNHLGSVDILSINSWNGINEQLWIMK